MPQQVLNPLTEYGRSGGILLLNPTDRANKFRYTATPAELRSMLSSVACPTYVARPSHGSTVAPASGTTAGSTGSRSPARGSSTPPGSPSAARPPPGSS